MAAILLLIVGCAPIDRPTMRTGSLPYPGLFTLYADVDPSDLGHHRYRGNVMPVLFADEASRGIVYTCRAGFLDMSHVRDSIDLTRYYYLAFADAVRDGESHVVVYGFSPCRFHVTLDLPAEWSLDAWADTSASSNHDRKQPLPDELDDALIDLAAQTAWITTTWYEFLQWYGYKSAGVISERRSAFTYDDIIAHAVGGDVARRALRHSRCDDTFNDAATDELERTLEELEALSPEQTYDATRAVEGQWWEGGQAIRRQLDLGLEDGSIKPWLVRDFAPCPDREPEPYDVPPLIDALRPDGEPLARIEIEMRILEAGAIRAAVPDQPQRLVPHRDFPHLIADMRADLAEQFGESFDEPYPDQSSPDRPCSDRAP